MLLKLKYVSPVSINCSLSTCYKCPNFVLDQPLGAKLNKFCEAWESRGAGPKVEKDHMKATLSPLDPAQLDKGSRLPQ